MKPEINIALLNAAQEIIGRFCPLIEDEYERSRLGSWGALVLISAMKFNDAASSLEKENKHVIDWLERVGKFNIKDLHSEGYVTGETTIDQLDKNNQLLRDVLNNTVATLEENGELKVIGSAFVLMRSMHQRRKVSDSIGLLQQAES